MESAARHGLSTRIALVGASIGVLTPVIGEIADAAEPFGIAPVVWVKAAAVLAVALIVSKAAQAVASIWQGGAAVVIDAPEPDLDIPNGEPDLTA